MVDGIGNGPKNSQNVQNRAANTGKEAPKGGLLGAAAGKIGDLLSGKKDSIQSDTLNVKGLAIERQAQADYQGSIDYIGGGKSGEYSYKISVDINHEDFENGTKVADDKGTVEYQGGDWPVDYKK